jgi:hypothetical protein
MALFSLFQAQFAKTNDLMEQFYSALDGVASAELRVRKG